MANILPKTTTENSKTSLHRNVAYLAIAIQNACILSFGNGSRPIFSYRYSFHNNTTEWMFIKVLKVEVPEYIKDVLELTITPTMLSLAQFLMERNILNGDIWIAINSNDPYLVMRSDRFIRESIYPQLFNYRYLFLSMSPVNRKLKCKKGKERLLIINDITGEFLFFPKELYYWCEHHNPTSVFFMCESGNSVLNPVTTNE